MILMAASLMLKRGLAAQRTMLKLARSTIPAVFTTLAPLATFALLALGPTRAWATMTKPPSALRGVGPASQTASRATKKNAKKVPKNAPVVLYQINRRETMALRLRDGKGRPVKGVQRRFDHFLRCHY